MKNAYWAIGLNFDYDVTYGEKPDTREWASIEGPYKTISEAKHQVREWLRSDRIHLASELEAVNKLTASKLRGGK